MWDFILVRNFNKLPETFVNSLDVPYDYNSIMHYSAHAYAVSANLITIYSLTPGITVGQGDCVSPLDAMQINLLYKCCKFQCTNKESYNYSIAKVPPPLNITVPTEQTIKLPFPCGQVYYANTTKTIHISYSHYPFIHCLDFIKLDPGYQLDLSFTFNIEYSGGGECTKDYLNIYIGRYKYGPYCGRQSLLFTQKLRHHVSVFYHTDGSDSYNGGFTGITVTAHVTSKYQLLQYVYIHVIH